MDVTINVTEDKCKCDNKDSMQLERVKNKVKHEKRAKKKHVSLLGNGTHKKHSGKKALKTDKPKKSDKLQTIDSLPHKPIFPGPGMPMIGPPMKF